MTKRVNDVKHQIEQNDPKKVPVLTGSAGDEDITSMDMHEASPLDIQPIQGPITRARAR
jgi:hypothetical protein